MLSRSVLAEPAPSAPLAGPSRLHRRAAYTRCLRCAGAPRRPASGSGLSLPFRPDMPSSLTPGSSDIACVQCRDADAAFAEIRAARHSQHSRNPFHAGLVFRGFTGSPLLPPVRLLAPLDGSDQVPPATGDFYIQASGGSVTLPAAGYDYNSTGLLCWRDFHPQEWQLASLHQTQPSHPFRDLVLPRVEHAGRIGASEPEVADDPERDCREAEAPVEGRFQGSALRGSADPAGRLLVPALPAQLP